MLLLASKTDRSDHPPPNSLHKVQSSLYKQPAGYFGGIGGIRQGIECIHQITNLCASSWGIQVSTNWGKNLSGDDRGDRETAASHKASGIGVRFSLVLRHVSNWSRISSTVGFLGGLFA